MFFYYGLLSLFFLGCGSDKGGNSEDGSIVDQEWWDELEEETNDSKDEEKDDYTDEDKEEYGDCGEEFDSTQPCEGSWEDTICLQDNLIWWCQDGVWMNEEEKQKKKNRTTKNNKIG